MMTAATTMRDEQAGPPAPPRWPALGRLRRSLSIRNASALYLLAFLVILFSIWEPSTFLSVRTWQVMLDNQAITGLVAIGLIVTLSAGVIDLAVGTEAGFGAIVVAWLLSSQGVPIPLAILLALAAGALVGVFITALIVRLRIPSMIATLAVSSILLAVIDWISGSQQILDLGLSFQKIATDELFGLAYPVYVLGGVSLIVWYFLERTVLGRRVRATGGNLEAAQLAGVRTSRMILAATITCGVIAALAGVLSSSQLATGDPTISQSFLLPAFAAAFLGSTQFYAGRFNVLGTLVAVLVLAVGVKGLQLAGAPIWRPDLFNGVALIAAVGFAQYQKAPAARTKAIRRVLRMSAERSDDAQHSVV
jgi:ribose transport system permease protein